MTLPSEFDNIHIPQSREFINANRQVFIAEYLRADQTVCDIGNQGKGLPDLGGAKLVTLDITGDTAPDVLADITSYNSHIIDGAYDAIMCTEVLEHVVDPFAAVQEIRRILKIGGHALFTTPLNARIHGPVPDCWRFTEFGLQVLFRDFEMKRFAKLDTPGRNLFPLHYGCIVQKLQSEKVTSDPRKIEFSPVD